MIKIYQKTVKDNKLKTLKDFKPGSWIYVEDPTEEEIKRLTDKASLNSGLLKDAIDPYEVPRIEIEDNIVYIFTRVPYNEGNKTVTVPILIAASDSFLVTISQKSIPFFRKFVNQELDFYTTQKAKMVLQILSKINTLYSLFITDITRKVRKVSVQLEKIENKDVVQFVVFENALNDFMGALVPISTLLDGLLSGRYLRLFDEDEELIEDLSLSIKQLIELCKSSLKNIVNIRESHSTIMTNNLNQVMKLLTSLTVILTIPTIISSIYGMNINLPFARSPLAFFWVMGTILIISFIVLIIFLKKRWF